MAEEEVYNPRLESQLKRKANRASSAEILASRGIAFTSHNVGAHLVVQHAGRTFDFWPGTGKWIERGTTQYRRGVFPLLKELANG